MRWGAFILACFAVCGGAVAGQDHADSPAWVFRAESLMLWQSAPQSQPLFDTWDPFVAEVTGPALDANQIPPGLAAGPKFTLIRAGEEGYGWEAAWFRVQSFTGTRALPVTDAGYAIAEGTTIYGNEFVDLDSVAASSSSALQSFEWLARLPSWTDRLMWTTGFRWVEWRDSLVIGDVYRDVLNSEQFFDRYDTSTINSLYGLQVGADAAVWRPNDRFHVDGVGKAGVYGNNARQSSAYTTDGLGATESVSIATSTGRAAFVGEVGATAVWQVTDRFAARVGYTAYWLGGVAAAARQLPNQELVVNPPPDPPTVAGVTDTGSSVFLHGITLGLEAWW
jgi:hypothetical protein